MGFTSKISRMSANRYKRNRLYRVKVYREHEQAPSAERIYNALAIMAVRITELSLWSARR